MSIDPSVSRSITCSAARSVTRSITRSVTRSVLALTLLGVAGCNDADGVAPELVEASAEGTRATTAAGRDDGAGGTADNASNDASDASARSDGKDASDGDGVGVMFRTPVHARLNAFGCEAADHTVFAGRYSAIHVYADVALLGPQRRRVPAQVAGRLSVGLPELLSGALITWDVAWIAEDNSLLLYGRALTPLGEVVVARLPLPRSPGVHAATINTTNMTTGAITNDAVSCAVR